MSCDPTSMFLKYFWNGLSFIFIFTFIKSYKTEEKRKKIYFEKYNFGIILCSQEVKYKYFKKTKKNV